MKYITFLLNYVCEHFLPHFTLTSATPEGQQELPENRSMRVENKNFYFDIGNNYRGIFMRLSEVQVNISGLSYAILFCFCMNCPSICPNCVVCLLVCLRTSEA